MNKDYEHAAAQVNELLDKLDREGYPLTTVIAAGLAVRLRNMDIKYAAEIAVRTPSALTWQSAALSLDEAMFALATLVEQQGKQVLDLPDEELAPKVSELALVTMAQVIEDELGG